MTGTVSAGDCDYQDARSELAEGGASCAHSNNSSSSVNLASAEAAHSGDLRVHQSSKRCYANGLEKPG